MSFTLTVLGHTEDGDQEEAILAAANEFVKQLKSDYPDVVSQATFFGRTSNAAVLGADPEPEPAPQPETDVADDQDPTNPKPAGEGDNDPED